MKLFELKKLRLLHDDMKLKGKSRAAFSITCRSKIFHCIFLADIRPFRLYLVTPEPKTEFFELEIFKEYCVSYVIVDFKLITRYLGLEKDTGQEFLPEDFLRILNARIPLCFNAQPVYYNVVRAAVSCRDIETYERNYFCGWKHNPDGKGVRYENYEKTRAAFGDETANLSRSKNVSSRWAAAEGGEKMDLFCDLF